MKALAQLWLQPCRQMPVLAVLANGLWLAAIACAWRVHPHAAGTALGGGLLAMGSWFWHLGLGLSLRGLCRPESFLLPGFRRSLTLLGLVDTLQWVVVPGLLAMLLGVPHPALATAGLLLAGAMGFAMGVERWISLLFWPLLILAGWMPGLTGEVMHAALSSPLTLPLLVLIAVLLLRLALLPMLAIDDRAPAASPLASMTLGRLTHTDPTRQRSAVARRVETWFEAAAQRALERSLANYRQRPDARGRLQLVRRLLLPHDNPMAIALRLALAGLLVTLYFLLVLHRPHFNATLVGAYAVLLALSRFPQLGRGLLRMRPNLADLYFTLAPSSAADYQRTMLAALRVLVPVSAFTAVAYTVLGIVLIHAAQPGAMLLCAAVIGTSASLVALAVHLIGPEGTLGRQFAHALVLAGAMGAYWGGTWLIDALGYAIGGGLLVIVALSFGAGVWLAAQHEYQQRLPCFDAPMG